MAGIDTARQVRQVGQVHPLLVRTIRYALIGFGSITVMSAVVNIYGAWQLIQVSDEAQLGFTRNEFMAWYVGPAILGVVLILCGALWRRKG